MTSDHSGRVRPAPEIRSGSHHVPNCLPNLLVAATAASETTPGHQKGLPSLILDSVWEPIWLQIGDSCPLREPYYLLCFHHKNTLRARAGSQQKTFTCIHNASETTFCAFFSPPWRPRGAPGLKTELPEGPEASQKAPQNPSKSPQNPLWSAMLCFRWSDFPLENCHRSKNSQTYIACKASLHVSRSPLRSPGNLNTFDHAEARWRSRRLRP